MKTETVVKYLGRPVKEVLHFKEPGTFKSYWAACGWLNKNGYSFGSTSVNRQSGGKQPVAVTKGEYDLPQKWHNLSKQEQESVIAVIDSDDYREGEVRIIFFEL